VALHVEGGETTSAEAAPKIETAVDESKLDTAAAKSEPVGASASATEPVPVVEAAPIQVRLLLSCCTSGQDSYLTLQFTITLTARSRAGHRDQDRDARCRSSRRRDGLRELCSIPVHPLTSLSRSRLYPHIYSIYPPASSFLMSMSSHPPALGPGFTLTIFFACSSPRLSVVISLSLSNLPSCPS
jgi:hypothetical protein